MTDSLNSTIVPTGEATAILPVHGGRMKPITVIGTDAIRGTFDELCLHSTALDPSMTETRYAVESWFFGPSAFPEIYVPLAA